MNALPDSVRGLFEAASRADYRVKVGKQQVMLFSGDGLKVGGWNTRKRHWYVSRVITEGWGELMMRHDFVFMDRKLDDHRWWQLEGAQRADAFRSVCEALTGVRFQDASLQRPGD